MSENEFAKVVVNAACQVHFRLGPDLIHFGSKRLRDRISHAVNGLSQDTVFSWRLGVFAPLRETVFRTQETTQSQPDTSLQQIRPLRPPISARLRNARSLILQISPFPNRSPRIRRHQKNTRSWISED